ncbi:serine/threonine-protein phosphatase 4 regulatory subunit 1-like [Sinocyclocheilus rhinocerous]|uniref:serine/threonine-protein phosphatase 4 regulatory subunit 1-like n=1 Tax=Sinocyclocheilus rhinocerous TaxID=307959 RepID=UPI0007B94C10|nr:PREDICTED: serine/threonine-protein phosphatase 4 regulatory subunit 1-like [Sinocyclocheilus rhinocerous]
MADLSLLQDSQEDTDGLLDFVSQDEMLTPQGRLDKYISSENVFNRQMVARSLLDTLRAVSEDERECVSVLERIDRLADDSVIIICKMAPMVGKDVTERLFLPRFCEMCCDCRMFHVRKVCAANFGDICSVVGGEATEELLLPRFFQLCSDNVWGVRKACAECFMTVSSASSPEVRRSKLSSLFISLISDPSRWVRQAAFQSLGPFISTFASSSSNTGQCFRAEAVAEWSGSQTHSTNTDAVCPPRDSCEEEEGGGEQTAEKCLPEETQPSSHPPAQEIPEQELFNSFHYWRTPIPQIQLELLQEEDRRPLAPALGRTQLQELIENLEPHTDDPDVKAQVDVLTAALRATALDSGLEDAFLEPRAARSNPFSSQQSSEHLSADTQRRDSSLHVMHDDDDSDVSDSSLSAEDQRKSKQQVSAASLTQSHHALL